MRPGPVIARGTALDRSRLQSVGGRVSELRQARGLSVAALAEQLEVPLECVRALEGGRLDPSIALLWRFAEAVDTSLSELLSNL